MNIKTPDDTAASFLPRREEDRYLPMFNYLEVFSVNVLDIHCPGFPEQGVHQFDVFRPDSS